MNRLILTGNGFDLAHGLKTSYNDFILWYLKKSFTTALEKQYYEDDLILIRKVNGVDIPEFLGSVDAFIEFAFKRGLFTIHNTTFKREGWMNIYDNPFKVHSKSTLLSLLLSKCSYTQWVEVENDFYKLLKDVFHDQSENREKDLSDLNTSLAVVIANLENYLLELKPNQLHTGYQEIFESKILAEELVTSSGIEDQAPVETLVLNFNYTSIIEEYFKRSAYNLEPKHFNVNYIHGKLGDSKNPIIFGFGDELDEEYKAMEHETAKGFFKYIKSFWYFRTVNYHKLLRFIESEEYQILILGHSCGLSDRTLLNMLFEHINCKSIRIYY